MDKPVMKAPHLTHEHIAQTIVSKQFHRFPDTTHTVCCLLLANGYTVIGESAAVSIENFDAEYGKMLAEKDATQKVWMLEGYLLKEQLSSRTGI